MARLVLTPLQQKSNFPALPITAASLDLAFVAAGADFGDGAGFAMTGKEVVIIRNPTGAPLTVTVSSAYDSHNRKGDITTYSLGASEVMYLPMFQLSGWVQTDGMLYMAASAATLEFAVIRLA